MLSRLTNTTGEGTPSPWRLLVPPIVRTMLVAMLLACNTTAPESGRRVQIGTRVKVEGFVEAIDADIRRLTVFSTQIAVSDTTEIDAPGNDDFEFEDFLVGMKLEVEGLQQPGGVVEADRIEIEDEAQRRPSP